MTEARSAMTLERQDKELRVNRQVRSSWTSTALYIGTALLSLLIVYLVMELWRADLRVPLYRGGDSYFHRMLVKNLVENGNWYVNDFLGAPGKSDLHDFPQPHVTHIAVLKFLSLFTRDYALVLNLYFLLSFPLTALISLFVLRSFKISSPSAVVASLLYSFVPYHFFRGEHHFFLALYYVVPLSVLMLIWVGTGEELFRFRRKNGQPFITRRGAAAVAICVLMTIDHPYYAFFGSCLLIAAGAIARFRFCKKTFGVTCALLSVIAITFVLTLVPNFVYLKHRGHNPNVGTRQPAETEAFGLKLSQLVLPVSGHRLNLFSALKAHYNDSPLVNENDNATLGIVGSCGFFILLFWVFVKPDQSRTSELLTTLSALNLGAFLLGTIGGLGVLFALLVSAQIRSINRISIYIAFFSLFAVALALDYLRPRLPGRIGQVAWFGGVTALLAIGIFDQTTSSFIPPYRSLNAQYAADADFVWHIQQSVPANAMIFQLPYMFFPEHSNLNGMQDYDLLTGYLHSRGLRWSYGAIHAREIDAWTQTISAEPVPELVQSLVVAGFSGIYIDRLGYLDHAAKLESQLEAALGVMPITSSDGRLSFFNLVATRAKMISKYNGPEWKAMRDKVFPPVLVTWQLDCSPLEGTTENNWRWCSDKGHLGIANYSSVPQKILLDMSISTGYSDPSQVQFGTASGIQSFRTNAAGTPVQLAMTVPPGEHAFEFRSDAKAVPSPRFAVFRINNFRLRLLP